jgi:hypothetical protein
MDGAAARVVELARSAEGSPVLRPQRFADRRLAFHADVDRLVLLGGDREHLAVVRLEDGDGRLERERLDRAGQ